MSCKVTVISIGDELLIGQTVNTNASWLGEELSRCGFDVIEGLTIRDERPAIVSSLDYALRESNVVLITGGLGPTKDDITKQVLADYFGMELKRNQEVLERIEEYFRGRRISILEGNKRQADLPDGCKVIRNQRGTASGMWFDRNDHQVVVSMPGVPHEMKAMMTEQVLPDLIGQFGVRPQFHHTYLVQGLPESMLAERLSDWETRLRDAGLKLAYLPSPGLIRLRITGLGEEQEGKAFSFSDELPKILPKNFIGTAEKPLERVLADELKEKGWTVGTVESCTAGLLAARIASVPGASEYYEGALLTYSYRLKTELADVSPETLEKYGAVSEQTVREMVEGGKKRMGVDCCVAISGIAGPDGGTDDKPVGTVWVAVSTPHITLSRKFLFGRDRAMNLEMTVLSSMNYLRLAIQGLDT